MNGKQYIDAERVRAQRRIFWEEHRHDTYSGSQVAAILDAILQSPGAILETALMKAAKQVVGECYGDGSEPPVPPSLSALEALALAIESPEAEPLSQLIEPYHNPIFEAAPEDRSAVPAEPVKVKCTCARYPDPECPIHQDEPLPEITQPPDLVERVAAIIRENADFNETACARRILREVGLLDELDEPLTPPSGGKEKEA